MRDRGAPRLPLFLCSAYYVSSAKVLQDQDADLSPILVEGFWRLSRFRVSSPPLQARLCLCPFIEGSSLFSNPNRCGHHLVFRCQRTWELPSITEGQGQG